MVGSIICGVDESASALGAARVARGLSGKLGLRLVFVRVVDEASADENTGATAERLERLTGGAGEGAADTQWLVDVGHPADRLVAAATGANASMIVVGSHGPRSSLLGSISADVSRRATCPVVVVVPPGAEHSLAEKRILAGGNDRDVGSTGKSPTQAASSASRSAPIRRRLDIEPRSRGAEMSCYDALMRWEWEGGTATSIRDRDEPAPGEPAAKKLHNRSQPTNRRQGPRIASGSPVHSGGWQSDGDES